MSGSEEDGQLRSPETVELSFDEEEGDTDSLDIKPPQAHRRDNERFKDHRKGKKHSKDRSKPQKYDRYYENQNNDRYYEKVNYKKDYRKHNDFPQQQQQQQQHYHLNQQQHQQHQQFDNYQFHKKKHHGGHYDRQKQKMYQMTDEEFLQQDRRKFESQYKNSTEVLEQDLRSRLLSKRNKHESNDYAHHIPADYEVMDKRREHRSPDHKKRHHHHHRSKAQAIEVIDSPETHHYEDDEEMAQMESDEEPKRHHKKSKKQKHHKHDKYSKVKQEPEDPELVSRRSKLLLAEKEILKCKEAAEARRKERATQESAVPLKEVRKRQYSSDEGQEEESKISKKKHKKHKKQSESSPKDISRDTYEGSEENAEEDESEESSSDDESSSSSSSSSEGSEKEEAGSSPLSIGRLEKSPNAKKSSPAGSSYHRSSRSRSLSHDRSRSRSRSRTEEREMKKAFEEEKAKELEKDVAMEEVKEESEEEDILYYPGIQGCRSVEEFACLNRIEEGTYGVVYRAKDKRTNEIVALKRLKMEREKEGFPITSLREINTLLKGQHPNIVTVREIVVGSNMDKIFIVMDYVEHDLKSLMETMKNKNKNFLPGEVKCLIKQLLQAIGHLHDNWILHRDLKTSNLLLSHKGILKVGDFGLAREYGSPLKHYTSLVVTLWYRAPELLLCTKEYSTPIDMWSVGCIFGEFMLMGALFPGKSEIDQLNKIFKELGTPNEKIWPGYKELPAVKDIMSQNSQFADYPVSNIRKKFFDKTTELGIKLLQGLLTYDPKQRFTAEKALKHEYFDELPLPIDPSMFPTWPAKSEIGARKVANTSPKPPSGGTQFKNLSKDEFAKKDGSNSQASTASKGFILHGGLDERQRSMGTGFQLKF